jgi:hypothetical protein
MNKIEATTKVELLKIQFVDFLSHLCFHKVTNSIELGAVHFRLVKSGSSLSRIRTGFVLAATLQSPWPSGPSRSWH